MVPLHNALAIQVLTFSERPPQGFWKRLWYFMRPTPQTGFSIMIRIIDKEGMVLEVPEFPHPMHPGDSMTLKWDATDAESRPDAFRFVRPH